MLPVIPAALPEIFPETWLPLTLPVTPVALPGIFPPRWLRQISEIGSADGGKGGYGGAGYVPVRFPPAAPDGAAPADVPVMLIGHVPVAFEPPRRAYFETNVTPPSRKLPEAFTSPPFTSKR